MEFYFNLVFQAEFRIANLCKPIAANALIIHIDCFTNSRENGAKSLQRINIISFT